MASAFTVLRTCGLIVYIVLQVCAGEKDAAVPWIVTVKVNEKSCVENNCKYLLEVHGGEFLGHYSWRLTPEAASKGSNCDVIASDYELREVKTDHWKTIIELIVPNAESRYFFCLRHSEKKNSPFGGNWVHQGQDLFLEPRNDVVSQIRGFSESSKQAAERESVDTRETIDLSHDIDVNNGVMTAAPYKRNDIEVFYNNKYVPLSQISDNYVQNERNNDNINYNSILPEGNNENINHNSNLPNNEGENINYNSNLPNNEGENINYNLPNEGENINHNSYLPNNEGENINHNFNLPNVESKNENDISNLPNNEGKGKLRNVKTYGNIIYDVENLDGTKDLIEIWNEKANLLNRNKRDTQTSKQAENQNDSSTKDIKNKTDELITTHDITKALKEQENAIKNINHEEHHEDALIKIRKERQVTPDDFTSVKAVPNTIMVEGLRVEDSSKEPKIIDDVPSVLAGSSVTLRLFGDGLTSRTVIAFTYDAKKYGEPCKFLVKGEYMVKPDSLAPRTALFEIEAPPPILGSKLYICAKNLRAGVTDPFKDEEKYIHQGTETYKILATHNKLLPLWVSILLILFCLMFSALFSGLNLGLMSLDRTELKIIANTGTEQERKYARAIMPVRDHGNYLLCSILLGNVAVNSTFTILLDELTSGLFAVIFSTLAIVLLGEITPQAICSRHGLMVGAKSIMITKGVMAVTAPLAYPVSKILDYLLGEEIGNVYNRERLKELVKVTTDQNDLDRDEVNIISGALELRKKTVSDVMTKLEDVFMLPISSVLDFETMSEIVKSGYSRIPVYEGGRGNIVTVLFIKDLAFVDPDDNTPLRTLCQYYQNPCNFVFEDVTLDVMFKQFKEGHKGHMAFVHRINNEGEGDPFYETIGLVTLEDVIEEMIQAEIIDETDVFMDNRTKRRRNKPQNKLHQDFTAFAERHENQRIHISPQLTLATFQFLSSSVDVFRPDTVSETVLRRLLKQDVIQHIKLKGKTKKDPSTFVYHQGKPVDYFVLILEGRVEVTVGRENLVFEAGPFTYFGVQALTQNVGVAESPTPSAMGSLQNINMDSMLRHTFVPDYSVRAITELFYLTVKRSLYLAAKRATLMEKGALSKGATNEQFDTEVDKHLCNSSSANIPISMISKKLLGKSTSTASTREDLGSTSTAHKLSPRLNIIELLQVTAQQRAQQSELAAQDRRPDSWPDTPSTYANDIRMSNKSFASSWETAKWSNVQDPSRSPCWPQELSKSLASACVSKRVDRSDVDAHNCTECVRNNFWMTKSVLNKSVDDVKSHDTDLGYKKKKTTFHTDSSLLTFHPVSPPTHDTGVIELKQDSKTRFDKTYSSTTNTSSDLNDFKISSKNANSKSVDENCDNDKLPATSAEIKLPKVIEIRSMNVTLDSKSGNLESRDSRVDKISFNEPHSSIDDREYERDIIDYSMDWRDDRVVLERKRIEMEEQILSQLSKILRILETKDQT